MTRTELAQKVIAIAWRALELRNRRAGKLLVQAEQRLRELGSGRFYPAIQSLRCAEHELSCAREEGAKKFARRAFLEVMLTER
jgi:hypothetical protein